MKKKKELQKLTEKADRVFSRHIRKKYANWKGEVACYTCQKVLPVEEMQNGHYESRGKWSTRFDEENCRPQCVGCNVFKNGNYPEFARKLVSEKGGDVLEGLHKKSRELLKESKKKVCQQVIETYDQLK